MVPHGTPQMRRLPQSTLSVTRSPNSFPRSSTKSPSVPQSLQRVSHCSPEYLTVTQTNPTLPQSPPQFSRALTEVPRVPHNPEEYLNPTLPQSPPQFSRALTEVPRVPHNPEEYLSGPYTYLGFTTVSPTGTQNLLVLQHSPPEPPQSFSLFPKVSHSYPDLQHSPPEPPQSFSLFPKVSDSYPDSPSTSPESSTVLQSPYRGSQGSPQSP
ncbi:hypothetical protein QE152_g25765 [Popillia japonica]|uniref:Uncharacterized protein n=1 Tax=Popillia japonica TaxID=7064 RepID=A0AAW1K0V8_POPJA